MVPVTASISRALAENGELLEALASLGARTVPSPSKHPRCRPGAAARRLHVQDWTDDEQGDDLHVAWARKLEIVPWQWVTCSAHHGEWLDLHVWAEGLDRDPRNGALPAEFRALFSPNPPRELREDSEQPQSLMDFAGFTWLEPKTKRKPSKKRTKHAAEVQLKWWDGPRAHLSMFSSTKAACFARPTLQIALLLADPGAHLQRFENHWLPRVLAPFLTAFMGFDVHIEVGSRPLLGGTIAFADASPPGSSGTPKRRAKARKPVATLADHSGVLHVASASHEHPRALEALDIIDAVRDWRWRRPDCFALCVLTDTDLTEFGSPILGRARGEDFVCVCAGAALLKSETDEAEPWDVPDFLLTAAHEILHVVGLDHCTFYRCVMNATISSRDDDDPNVLSEGFLCPVCLLKLQAAMRHVVDIETRATALAEFYESQGWAERGAFLRTAAGALQSTASEGWRERVEEVLCMHCD